MILNSKYNFLIPYKVKKLIRFGRNFDGGYLVCSDAIKNIDNLITLGVGDDISFERDLEKKLSLKKVHMYDFTVNHYLFLKIILKYFRRLITFRTKIENLIYSINNYINFIKFNNKKNVSLFKRRVVDKVKERVDINLKNIFEKIKSSKNLLKLDIEGGEYSIIKQIDQNSKNINILIIEFHFIKRKKNLFTSSIKQLLNNFDIVHIHANNYFTLTNKENFFEVLEVTFVNKKINKYKKDFRYNFPLKDLDFECFPDRKKIKFSFKIKQT
jgi:hypothetical protein|tara:strand:+ start:1039 stop:1848 length:810 start_codon:yes stop_codon:yes gene_type:complete